MSPTTKNIISMIEILPENDKNLAYELIKKLVLAWDPDFTKATQQEIRELERAEKEIENGDYVTHNDINWE